MSTFDRYTDGAKRAIYFAHLEAVHRNEEVISVGDLLIGLTWDSDSRAARLVALKNAAVQLRAASQVPHLPSTPFPYKREAHVPLDDDAKKVLAYAAEEADDDHEWWIDTDHLLRAFLRFNNSATPLVLGLGLDLSQLRAASKKERTNNPPLSTPKLKYFKDLVQRHWVTAALVVICLAIILLVKWHN